MYRGNQITTLYSYLFHYHLTLTCSGIVSTVSAIMSQFCKVQSIFSQLLFVSPQLVIINQQPCKSSTCKLSKKQQPIMLAGSNQKNKRLLSPRNVNRQARANYEFLETYECGIELVGTEVKSVRNGNINLRDGYARVKDGQIYLHNVHISPWHLASNIFNHDPIRPRRLLLHKRSIRKLQSKQKDTGVTMVPTQTYFSNNGFLKVEIALARGKQLHDKREDIKKRELAKEMHRVIKATLS